VRADGVGGEEGMIARLEMLNGHELLVSVEQITALVGKLGWNGHTPGVGRGDPFDVTEVHCHGVRVGTVRGTPTEVLHRMEPTNE
jgi:hypothetical protein